MTAEYSTTRHEPRQPDVPSPGQRRRRDLTSVMTWSLLLIISASWVFVFIETSAHDGAIISWDTWSHATQFLSRFVGIGERNPAYLDAGEWRRAFGLAADTLAMSVLAIGLSTIGMLLTVMVGARPAEDGSLVLGRHPLGRLAYGVIRIAYIVSRAVPELIWAMLIVFILSPGVLPAAVALGLHNFGILGKLCAEVIEDTDARPIRSLRASGASASQTLLYAVLPAALPHFLTYILYRWEVIIRATIVVGFVSASGLGREFRLSMSYFHYTEVALLLLVYFLLVIMVDLVGAGARRLAR